MSDLFDMYIKSGNGEWQSWRQNIEKDELSSEIAIEKSHVTIAPEKGNIFKIVNRETREIVSFVVLIDRVPFDLCDVDFQATSNYIEFYKSFRANESNHTYYFEIIVHRTGMIEFTSELNRNVPEQMYLFSNVLAYAVQLSKGKLENFYFYS